MEDMIIMEKVLLMVIMENSIQMDQLKKAGKIQLDTIKEEKVKVKMLMPKIKKVEMMMKKELQRKRRLPRNLSQLENGGLNSKKTHIMVWLPVKSTMM